MGLSTMTPPLQTVRKHKNARDVCKWHFKIFILDNSLFPCHNMLMLNQTMPTVEETISPNDIAQWEHEQWLRAAEGEDRWAEVEAAHGPLMARNEWQKHCSDLNAWFAEGVCK